MPGFARPVNIASAKETFIAPFDTIQSNSLQGALEEIVAEGPRWSNPSSDFEISSLQTSYIKSQTNNLSASVSNDGTLYVPKLNAFGSVVQVKTKRLDISTSVTTGVSGIEITDLRVSITPKFSNSLILCFFQIHGEGASTHEYLYTVYKNGVVPSGTYAGVNNVQGDVAWSGIAMALPYEIDYASTPFTQHFMYFDVPGVTTEINYAPGVKTSTGTSYIYYINRPVSSTGASSYEVGVSFAIAMEIVQ